MNIIVVVNMVKANILTPAKRFVNVNEYFINVCNGQLFCDLSKPEGCLHPLLMLLSAALQTNISRLYGTHDNKK